MEKHTLTFVGRYTNKRDGSPLIGSNGKPYTSLRIKTNAYGDKYLSGFENAGTKSWKVGDTVDIEIEQKGDFLNFTTPKAQMPSGGMSPEQYQSIMRELVAIRQMLQVIKQDVDPNRNLTSAGLPVPDFSQVPNIQEEEFDDPFAGMNVL